MFLDIFKRNKILNSKISALICRIILGSVFLYSSLCKIYLPIQFARAIHNYQIIPDMLARFTAVFLPWIEFTAGLFLLFGLLIPGALRVILGLICMFITVLTISILRGTDIKCGCITDCFTGRAIDHSLWQALILNLFYLVCTIPVFLYDKSKKNR